MRGGAWIWTALLLWAAAGGFLHAAPGDRVGPQFQVSSYTTGQQTDPAVAADGAGGFVVTWDSDGSSGTDQSETSILGQRYDAAGTPVGGEFQVNTYTTSYQFYSNVVPLGSGFLVVWGSTGSPGTDDSISSIHAQRFDSTGPVGTQFQVNTYTTSYQGFSAVAPLQPDGFVVVWTSGGSAGTDTSGSSIQGRRFDGAAAPLDAQFQVNTYTTSYQRFPSVAALGGGAFVVVWTSNGSAGTDTSDTSIQAQRFDAAGAPEGVQFQVNTYTVSDQQLPSVSPDATGGFNVVWSSRGSHGTDTDNFSVQIRRFDAEGRPQGPEFQVNTYTTGSQAGYILGPDGIGGFVVAWDSNPDPFGGGSQRAIRARRFAATGYPLADDFQVNADTTGDSDFPGIAPDGAGGFVVVWRSGAAGQQDILAQRFEGVLAATTTTSSTTITPGSTTTSTSITTPTGPGEAVEGRSLDLASRPGRADKSKLKLVAKDAGLTLGRGNGSADDPVLHGGAFAISSADGGFAATHDLDGSWRYVGKAGQGKGYAWKSSGAPIRAVQIKRGSLVVVGQGAALGFDLDDDPEPVRVRLAIGEHTYCLEFGGDERRFRVGRLFQAKRAAAPAACP